MLGEFGAEVASAIRDRNTAALFDWLVAALSYQGISDQVASDYMDRHGLATWQILKRSASATELSEARKLLAFPRLPVQQDAGTRAPSHEHLPGCPLPNHWLRNGRLNQTAYSLHLFIRDIAGGDLVGWIDRRLDTAARQSGPNRLARMRAALVEPLKEVYGVSDKVLMMALSQSVSRRAT